MFLSRGFGASCMISARDLFHRCSKSGRIPLPCYPREDRKYFQFPPPETARSSSRHASYDPQPPSTREQASARWWAGGGSPQGHPRRRERALLTDAELPQELDGCPHASSPRPMSARLIFLARATAFSSFMKICRHNLKPSENNEKMCENTLNER